MDPHVSSSVNPDSSSKTDSVSAQPANSSKMESASTDLVAKKDTPGMERNVKPLPVLPDNLTTVDVDVARLPSTHALPAPIGTDSDVSSSPTTAQPV